jgi:hypothetical protein
LQTIQGAPDRAGCQFTPNLVAVEVEMVRAMERGRRGGRIALPMAGALLVVLLGRPSGAADAVPLDEHTALMVGRHQLELGVAAFEHGITHDVSVGLPAPAWVAGAFSPIFRGRHRVVSRNPDGFELRGSNGTFSCSIELSVC